MSLTKVSYSMVSNAPINVKDYGALGDGIANDTAAIQAAVTYATNNSLDIFFPSGVYHISSPITFGPDGFTVFGNSASETIIREIAGSGQIKLFDFTGLSGSTCSVRDISFYGASNNTFGGTGIHIESGSGFDINNCWFAGLLNGIYKAADTADIVINQCTFESNFTGIRLVGGAEIIVANNILYLNGYDYWLSGDFISCNFSNSNHLGTLNACVYMDSARFVQLTNMTCSQEFQQYLPPIIDMVNACSFNNFNQIQTKNFGSVLIRMAAGAACTNNTFDNLTAALVTPPPSPVQPPPPGTLGVGIEIGSSNSGNSFSNFNIYGAGYGLVVASNNNKFTDGIINACTIAGTLIQAATDNEFSNVKFVNNAVDWSTPGGSVDTVWLENIDSSLSGFTPVRYGQRGAGISGRIFYGTAVPTTLAYLIGDVVFNTNPVVGQPKGWTCTVSGTPGTWVSQGNL